MLIPIQYFVIAGSVIAVTFSDYKVLQISIENFNLFRIKGVLYGAIHMSFLVDGNIPMVFHDQFTSLQFSMHHVAMIC